MTILRLSLLLLILAVGPALALEDDRRPWVVVDSEGGFAEVRSAEGTLLVLPNLAFGRAGTSPLHLAGDHTTPLGQFRITRINRDSRYHVFLGLNYPTLSHLDAANRRGVIGDREYGRLVRYGYRNGQLPANTPLGGHIGLHGLGDADPAIHSRMNWTQGCVAMTDEQIEQLLEYVDVGTRVVIR